MRDNSKRSLSKMWSHSNCLTDVPIQCRWHLLYSPISWSTRSSTGQVWDEQHISAARCWSDISSARSWLSSNHQRSCLSWITETEKKNIKKFVGSIKKSSPRRGLRLGGKMLKSENRDVNKSDNKSAKERLNSVDPRLIRSVSHLSRQLDLV